MEESKTLIVIIAVVAIVAIFAIVYLKPNAPLQSQTIAGQAMEVNNELVCPCYYPADPNPEEIADRPCPFPKTCKECCGRLEMEQAYDQLGDYSWLQ